MNYRNQSKVKWNPHPKIIEISLIHSRIRRITQTFVLIFTISDQTLKLNEFTPENRKFIAFFELVPHRSNFLSRNDSSIEWSAKKLNAQWKLVNVYRYLYLPSIHSLLRDRYLLDSVEVGRRLVEFRFLDLSFETSRVTNDIGSSLLRGTHCRGNDLDLENPSYSTLLSHPILTDFSSQLWPLYSTISR